MLLLEMIPYEMGVYFEAVLDTVLLAILSSPIIYFWVIRPFVSARDKALAQISHMAATDPLTGLANRRLTLKHLDSLIATSARHKDHGAVLLIDLDGFKPINDSHGHEAGDAMLIGIADRLRSAVRAGDTVGRLGGDEFVVLLSRLDADARIASDHALRIAEKLVCLIGKPVDFNGKTLHIGASIGIRLLGTQKLDTETAMREADRAMYQAKQTGKGCVAFPEI